MFADANSKQQDNTSESPETFVRLLTDAFGYFAGPRALGEADPRPIPRHVAARITSVRGDSSHTSTAHCYCHSVTALWLTALNLYKVISKI